MNESQLLAHRITVLFRGERFKTIVEALNIIITEQRIKPSDLPSLIGYNQTKTEKQ